MKLIICLLFLSNIIIANEVTSNIGFVTDYVWRGQTLSNHTPAIQGGLDYTHSFGSIDLGIGDWVSNSTEDSYNMENDLYASISKEVFKDFTTKVQYTWFQYVEDTNSNLSETSLGLTYVASSFITLDTSLSYSDNYGETTYIYYSFTPTMNLQDKLSLAPSIGYSVIGDKEKMGYGNYTDYKISLTKSYEDGWKTGIGYSISDRKILKDDATDYTSAKDKSLYLTISRSF